MKNDFLLAIGALAAEKNLPKDIVLEAVEAALTSAFRREGENAPNIYVKIDPESGDFHTYMQKAVVEIVEEPNTEISVGEARRYKKDAAEGDVLDFEMPTPDNAGRIAAQTAKQVVLQRLREAERDAVFDEYSGKEGEILRGLVQRVEPRQIMIELGKGTEAVLPSSEQVRNEHLRPGQPVKVVVLEVLKAAKGPQVVVSRSHRSLLRRLFEMEIPEISQGVVEIKSIAREGGHRSKVAVHSRVAGVDPIGACVGPRGARIQNVVNELAGERIDVIKWDPEPAAFVANALSPAQVVDVTTDEEEKRATVVVPDRMLSLAIGKEGQNARLAAKLTGWRIDIHSQSASERGDEGMVEAPSTFEPFAPGEEPDIDLIAGEEVEEVAAEVDVEAAAALVETAEPMEPGLAEPEPAVAGEEEEEEEELADDEDEEYEVPTTLTEEERPAAIRFAEDVLPRKADEDEEVKRPAAKKARRAPRFVEEEEDDLEDIDYSGRIH